MATAPFFVEEDEPYRPMVCMWLELPAGVILGNALSGPGHDAPFAESLVQALTRPAVGKPRRPERIRVATPALAAEVRRLVPGVVVRVAPTPELDEVMAHMMAHLVNAKHDHSPPSYLDDGRLDPAAVAAMFRAAGALWDAAPWEILPDCDVLRVDIPSLDVRGACVSVIGELGETRGVVVFPSLAAFERFIALSEEDVRDDSTDLGTSMLSLTFLKPGEIEAEARAEIAAHGWSVAEPDALPWVTLRDSDGVPCELCDLDVRIATACAFAASAFVTAHEADLAAEVEYPLRATYVGEGGVEIHVAFPCAPSHLRSVGDPPAEVPDDPVQALHVLDADLFDAMVDFADEHFEEQWWARAERDFYDYEDALALFRPWLVYGCAVDGKPLAVWYREHVGDDLPAREQAWLDAQARAWLSMWEVEAVEPGRGMTLRDLLSGEQRDVRETGASKSLTVRDVVLARVVDVVDVGDAEGVDDAPDRDDVAVLVGMYPRALPPLAAAEVERRLRGRLRRKRDVPVERLRAEAFGRYAIACWEDALHELAARADTLPALQNTDRDPLLWTVDHFDVSGGTADRIARSVAEMPGAETAGREGAARVFRIGRVDDPSDPTGGVTIIGRILVEPQALRIETNSTARADALRARVEAAVGDAVSHRARTHRDLLAHDANANANADAQAGAAREMPSSPMVDAAIMAYKQQHYAAWADQPIPALGGRTPRDAATTQQGRRDVDTLVKQCEHAEARLPPAQRFDFEAIRRELGL